MAAPGLPARLSRRRLAHSGYRASRRSRDPPPEGAQRTLARHAPGRRRQAGIVDARGWAPAPAPRAPHTHRLRARGPAADRHAGLRRLERRDRARPRRARARRAPSDVPGLQAASAVGQGLLAGAWQRALASAGGRAAQVLLTADDVRRRTSYLNARATLEALLAWDVVPIVNENDSTATDEITFGDNDALAAQVALLLRARLLVLLTDAEASTPAIHAQGRRARARGARPRAARRPRARRRRAGRARLGRHALEGRRGLDGRRRRRRLRDRVGRATRDDRARRGGQDGRHALQRGPPARIRVEALAALRQAARPGACSSTQVRARAADAWREPAAGRREAAWRGRSGRATRCACARSTARSSPPASWPWGAPSCAARPASTRPSPASPRPSIAIIWCSTMAVTTESASARARAAARTLATLGRGAKDAALEQIALALERERAPSSRPTPRISPQHAPPASRARCSTGSRSTPTASSSCATRSAPSRRSRIPSATSSAAGGCPTGSTCRRCACRSACCSWSTRRAPT